jgi:hypothetical protein
VGPLVLLALVPLLFHRANPDALGHTAAGITMLARTAFGIGMLTGK